MFEVRWSDVNTGLGGVMRRFTYQDDAVRFATERASNNDSLTFTVTAPREDGYRQIVATFRQRDYHVDREVNIVEQ